MALHCAFHLISPHEVPLPAESAGTCCALVGCRGDSGISRGSGISTFALPPLPQFAGCFSVSQPLPTLVTAEPLVTLHQKASARHRGQELCEIDHRTSSARHQRCVDRAALLIGQAGVRLEPSMKGELLGSFGFSDFSSRPVRHGSTNRKSRNCRQPSNRRPDRPRRHCQLLLLATV